jgi:hypothetical protein
VAHSLHTLDKTRREGKPDVPVGGRLGVIQANNMRTHACPLFVLPLGAALLSTLLCQRAQAQSAVPDPGSATLASIANAGATSDMLTVNYGVSYTSGANSSYYTYDYTIFNPSTSGALVESFNLAFNTTPAGAVFDLSGGAQVNGSAGVTWDVAVLPGQTSASLSFESDYGPTMNNASAGGGNENDNLSAPWASNPGGQQVAVPNTTTVPEPATTTLLALALGLVPFRSFLAKRR